ncbi:MAG: S-methyl-5-thioribose-1-phosphate isomerase [Acidobacteriota bacterium]
MQAHICWTERRTLRLMDQRLLPLEVRFEEYDRAEAVAEAIRSMVVRGAPAIGVTAAYAMALSAAQSAKARDPREARRLILRDADLLRQARPTAVNLAWAVDRMVHLAQDLSKSGAEGEEIAQALADEAVQIHADDIAACRAIGRAGLPFVPEGATILTHCNAGALATGGYGTALGVVRAAHEASKLAGVLADETRPFLQGARLTAWELHEDHIPVTLLCDSAAGALMAQGRVSVVVVGADRIAANGDTANKIGTFSLAVLARHHGIPFLVAAPRSTFDPSAPDGSAIPIEQRAQSEVLSLAGRLLAPDGVKAVNPAFDVTPHDLIHAILTEDGPIHPVGTETVSRFLAKAPA